jgi:hypothetical protein
VCQRSFSDRYFAGEFQHNSLNRNELKILSRSASVSHLAHLMCAICTKIALFVPDLLAIEFAVPSAAGGSHSTGGGMLVESTRLPATTSAFHQTKGWWNGVAFVQTPCDAGRAHRYF